MNKQEMNKIKKERDDLSEELKKIEKVSGVVRDFCKNGVKKNDEETDKKNRIKSERDTMDAHYTRLFMQKIHQFCGDYEGIFINFEEAIEISKMEDVTINFEKGLSLSGHLEPNTFPLASLMTTKETKFYWIERYKEDIKNIDKLIEFVEREGKREIKNGKIVWKDEVSIFERAKIDRETQYA